MDDPHRFLHARIGRVDEWTVRARLVEGRLPGDPNATSGTSLRHWVSLDLWRGDLMARTGDATLALQLARLSDVRRIRAELASWSRPFVAYLELSGARDAWLEGALVVMRTALPGRLTMAPTIVVDRAVLDEIEDANRPRLEELAAESVLPSGDGPVMVVTAPFLTGTVSTAGIQKVSVHLHRRWALDCDVVGEPGAQHLVAREIKRGVPAAIPDGRLLAIPGPPQVLATSAEAMGTELSAMLPARHELFEAWIAYEQLAQDRRLQSYDRRRGHPLEYAEVAASSAAAGGGFRVVLASPQDVYDHWIEGEGTGRRRRLRVSAAVQLVDLEDERDPLTAILQSFDATPSGGLEAVVRLASGSQVPPVRGRIVAVEDRGDAVQRERRKRALDRLRRGTSANPELLGWLMNPQCVPVVDASPRAGASLAGLDEHQRRAVALATRAPSIVLVLGPPGSGKTTVIRAIVEEYRKRVRNGRGAGDGVTPFRVLVTSIQGEAVDNVAEKIGGGADLEVWQIGDGPAREAKAQRLADDAQRIASDLWKQLRDTPRFVAYERYHRVRDSVALMRDAMFDVGVGPELSERLRALRDSDEHHALTPLLAAQLGQLVERLDRAFGGPRVSPTEPSAAPASALAATLDAVVRGFEVLAPEAWPALAGVLDRMAAALQEPTPADAPWVELSERWRDLHRRLRREARATFTRPSEEAFAGLRTETVTALAAVAGGAPVAVNGQALDTEIVDLVHVWLQRAATLIDTELRERARGEEAVLFHWLHTLASEPGRLAQVVERHAMVTAATCQRVDQARGDEPPDEFDVVIVDEAARAGIDLLVPMTLGRSIVLVGDQRQLPPHIEKDLADQLEEGLRVRIDLERASLFSWLWDRLPPGNVVALQRQYRMHEDIGRAVSRLFYEPHGIVLEHHFADERASQRRPAFGLCDDQPLVWIDTSDVLQDPLARVGAGLEPESCVERNEYEVRIIARLLRRLDRDALRAWRAAADSRTEPVGLITFYGEQRALLQDLLTRELGGALDDLVKLGPVDSFQGREFPLVILSAVRSNGDGFVGFLRLPNRVNVAMSRAQRQLIIVGDIQTLAAPGGRSSAELQQLDREMRSGRLRGSRLPSAEVVR